MPSLDDLDVSMSPLADPYGYPGVAVDADYLCLGWWMYGVVPSGGVEVPRWRVAVDGGPLATAGVRPEVSLAEVLTLTGAAPISARHPVVSFGSNSAPAQVRDKFAALDPASKIVPVLRGSVRGLSLGHSPHVSVPGYLPYVLLDNGSPSALPVFVLWLDSLQLAVMNGTEPNYDLVSVPAGRYPLTLSSGENVASYAAYKGKWGALQWPGRTGPVVAGSQQSVFAGLNEASWFRALAGPGDVGEQMSRFRVDAGLREKVRVELAARGWRTTDGWAAGDTRPRGSTSTARMNSLHVGLE